MSRKCPPSGRARIASHYSHWGESCVSGPIKGGGVSTQKRRLSRSQFLKKGPPQYVLKRRSANFAVPNHMPVCECAIDGAADQPAPANYAAAVSPGLARV